MFGVRKSCFIACLTCLLAVGARADAPVPFLLVFPIFGHSPPEMRLPWAKHLAESLLLELPEKGLRVEAQEPTEPILPGAIETVARQRASEVGAQAVLWGELIQAKDCRAPRMIRLRILELSSETLLSRDLCPEGAGVEDISRALALAAVNALRAGELESLRITPPPAAAGRIAAAPRCEKPAPCPDCPPCPALPPPKIVLPPWERPFSLTAAGALTSHPSWEALGLGLNLDLNWSPWPWIEFGLGVSANRGRGFSLSGVRGLYTSWPLRAFAGFRFGARIEGLVRIGLALAWSRLDVLLPQTSEALTSSRLNPFLFAHAGLRYWMVAGLGLQVTLGPSFYLRRQRYTHGPTGQEQTVLAMQTVSFEASLGLILAFP